MADQLAHEQMRSLPPGESQVRRLRRCSACPVGRGSECASRTTLCSLHPPWTRMQLPSLEAQGTASPPRNGQPRRGRSLLEIAESFFWQPFFRATPASFTSRDRLASRDVAPIAAGLPSAAHPPRHEARPARWSISRQRSSLRSFTSSDAGSRQCLPRRRWSSPAHSPSRSPRPSLYVSRQADAAI